MSPRADRPDDDSPVSLGHELAADLDRLFDVLAHERRRCVLRSLSLAGGDQAFDDLAAAVARETSVEPVSRDRRDDVATTLYHVHLPKLADAGLVDEFDPDGAVTIGEAVDDLPERVEEFV